MVVFGIRAVILLLCAFAEYPPIGYLALMFSFLPLLLGIHTVIEDPVWCRIAEVASGVLMLYFLKRSTDLC